MFKARLFLINLGLMTLFSGFYSVSAQPVCYMVYPNGDRVNLTSLCGTSKSSRNVNSADYLPDTDNQNNPSITKPSSSEVKKDNITNPSPLTNNNQPITKPNSEKIKSVPIINE